jgi:chromosome segregation ATPase
MSCYEEDLGEKPYSSNEYSKSVILADLAVSKLESKLSLQRGASSLNLSDSFIGDEGCALVASYIKENLGLHSLEMRGNSIAGEGLKHLASALRGQNFVRTISLEWNNIGDSIGNLLDVLSYSSSLQYIDLRNNRIGPDGASAIARFIENSPSIAKIDLRWNELGVLGGKKLLNSVSRSRSLRVLELSGNKIPEDLILQIEQLLRGDDKANRTDGFRDEKILSRTDDKSFRGFSDFRDVEVREVRENRETREGRSSIKSPSRTKDFNYNDELYAKYEAQMITNARNEARINELEILLEQETRKVQDVKNELLKDLDAEKARRAYSDENFMMYKEEALKREMELERNLQEIDSKLSRTANEKNLVLADLDTLQQQYEKLHISSQDRIRALEERLSQQERSARQLEESARQSLDRNKKESEQTLYEVSRDYQNKLEIADESQRNLRNQKESLETEVKSLKSQIIQIKTQSQEALADLEYQLREEENNKYTTAVRNFEGRIKTLEDSREGLNKRLTDTQREFAQSEKRGSDQVNNLENNLNALREEKNELSIRLQKVTAQKDNLSNDLYITKSALDRAEAENEELNHTLKERKEAHVNQLEKVCQEHAAERKSLEGNRDLLIEQSKQLESELNRVRRDRDRIIKEHEYLADILKQRVTALIQDTVLGHMRKLENE